MSAPRLLLFKKLTLAPSGMISDGWFQYTIDPVTGEGTWSASIDVEVVIFQQNIAKNGPIKLSPSMLVSANLKVGDVITFGPLNAKVLSIASGKAQCSVSVVDAANEVNELGTAEIDVSGQYVELNDVKVTGTVQGYSITLNAAG